MRGTGYLALSVLLAATCARSQESASPSLRITVTLVQVDVVVTDSKGRRVADLSPNDFEILQDGKKQPLKSFVWNPAPVPTQSTEKAPLPKNRLPIPAPAVMTAADIRRTVAVVVDDISMSFENIQRVRSSLRTFVEKHMEPGDLVAIVRTGGGVAAMEQFTADRRMLLAYVDLLKWRFSGRCGVSPPAPVVSATGDAAATSKPQMLDYGCSLAALGTVGTLEQVVRGMRRMPGRKSIVLLSNSMAVPERLHESMDHLTDLANRSAVSIYAVDPEGLSAKSGVREVEEGSADLPGTISSGGLGGALGELAEQAREMEEGPRYLAMRTGGVFYQNSNDIARSIRQATDDQLGYYLLGYTPDEDTFASANRSGGGTPKFHKVTVRVLRPGLRVRWKSGFSGVPDELRLTELDNVPKTREEELAEALASPFTASGIRVRLTSMFTMLKDGRGPAVRSLLHFDGRDLHFQRQDDGQWQASVDVTMLAFRGIKQSYVQSQSTQQIRLTDELHRKAMREGFVYNLPDIAAKVPGPVILRAVVRDAESRKLGSASQVLDVPDLRKGNFGVSSINLNLASRELVTRVEGREPTSGDAGEAADGGPALRRYRQGQSVVYGLLAVNPKLKSKQPKLASQLRIYRNGKAIFEGAVAPVVETRRLDDQRFVVAGMLRLGSQMAPGEYLLHVALRDEGRRGKPWVSQWVDFEVLGSGTTTSVNLPASSRPEGSTR